MGACASRPRALPGDRSGRGHPLSPRECPRHPLTPAGHLQPTISGPLPQGARTTWAGVRVTGLSCWKPADPSVQSSPLRRSPCSSIRKRVPPYGWKNGGGRGRGPQEPAFVGAAPSWCPAKTRGPAGSGQAPPPEASLRATCPTLQVSGQHHRVPGVVSVEREALPATQGTAPFPVDHTSQLVSHTRRVTVPAKE